MQHRCYGLPGKPPRLDLSVARLGDGSIAKSVADAGVRSRHRGSSTTRSGESRFVPSTSQSAASSRCEAEERASRRVAIGSGSSNTAVHVCQSAYQSV